MMASRPCPLARAASFGRRNGFSTDETTSGQEPTPRESYVHDREYSGSNAGAFEAAHGAAKSHCEGEGDPTSGPESPRDFRA